MDNKRLWEKRNFDASVSISVNGTPLPSGWVSDPVLLADQAYRFNYFISYNAVDDQPRLQ